MDPSERTDPQRAGRLPYRPPRLRRIGSIADLTQAEGSGPGGLGMNGIGPAELERMRGAYVDQDIFGIK